MALDNQHPHPNEETFDVVVIGSGAGGLTAAVALANAGQKVLVAEQHEVAGGWTHSFTLEGYRFSPGVHYIGGLEPGGHLRRIYEGLGVSGDLAFCQLNPAGYDHVIIGDEQFDIPAGLDNYKARLKARFPAESAGIDGYFDCILSLNRELRQLGRLRPGRDLWVPTILRWGLGTARPLLNHFVQDPHLQTILAAQSGDHGLPPNQVSAMVHAGIVGHYLDGGYYPMGGGGAIPKAFVRALRRANGQLRLRQAVRQILVERGRVAGVQLANGDIIRAPVVISNADPAMTFGRLLDPAYLNWRWRRKLQRARYSVSALSLFLAVDMDLRAAGLDSGNYWLYDRPDLDTLYGLGLTDHTVRTGEVPAAFLTVTTLKDPTKLHSGHHTLEAFTFTSYDPFARWADQPEGNRGAEYEALKSRLAEAMLRRLERLVPGLRQHLVFCNLGTPLTNLHYVAAPQGSLYGLAKTPFQVGPWAYSTRTPLPGLLLCGASTLSHGVAGATQSGLQAAAQVLGSRPRDLLTANSPPPAIYPSEQPDQWPAHLQQKIAQRQAEMLGVV